MRKTILATAYAVNPYKGSEDGTGWNQVLQIAKNNPVIVVTRQNNRESIEQFRENHSIPESHPMVFLYFDLPYWLRFWKKGERGAMLYFYLWQMAMPIFLWAHRKKFDIVHNLNFHNDWTPTFLWLLGKPLIWGPVGHHPRIPKDYILKPYGAMEYLKSRMLWVTKLFFWKLDPFLRVSLMMSKKIIAINSGVGKIHFSYKSKMIYMPAVGASRPSQDRLNEQKGEFRILSVGRLVPMKGFDVVLAAFGLFYQGLSEEEQKKVSLNIVGKGPLKQYLKHQIGVLNLEGKVQLTEWVAKEAIGDIYNASSLFFFPSHEGAGMVVPEALSFGLPILCFDNEGPGEFVDDTCGKKVPYSNYHDSVEEFAKNLTELFRNKMVFEKLREGARVQFETKFDWDVKGVCFKNIYDEVAA